MTTEQPSKTRRRERVVTRLREQLAARERDLKASHNENQRLRARIEALELRELPPPPPPIPTLPNPRLQPEPAAGGTVMGALKVPEPCDCGGTLNRKMHDPHSGMSIYLCDTCQNVTKRIGTTHG